MRVNRGGERLTIQEIRNASNVGKVTYLLNKISDNKELRIVPIKRKKDQYLVLRFLAYYLIHNNESFMSIYNFDSDYDGIDNLLDRVMKFINIISDSESCIQISKRMFELKSYKEFSRKDSNAVNMIIFESWLFLISSFEKSVIETNLDLFFDFYIKFIDDENFEDNILYRRDSKEKLTWRFSYIEKFIKDIKQSLKLKDIL